MNSAIVIGGGVAGATLATLLARADWAVTLVESARFPRIKVCGEFISPAATEYLENILPPAALAAVGASRIDTFTLECGGPAPWWVRSSDRSLSTTFASPAWALSRATLDTALLAVAASAHVTILQPATVRGVAYHDTHITVTVDDSTLTADLVIHADGSGRHDPSGPTPNAPGIIGRKCHATLPPGLVNGVQIRACNQAYVGSIIVEGGLATIALVARAALVARFGTDGDALLQHLWPVWQPAWRTSDWKTCPVPRGPPITSGHPRSFRIGNAAAAVDPIGGEGIGLALWSASTLAELLQNQPADRAAIQRRFLAAYRSRVRTRRPACRLAAALLMRPQLVTTFWPLLARHTGLTQTWLALTGKPHTLHGVY